MVDILPGGVQLRWVNANDVWIRTGATGMSRTTTTIPDGLTDLIEGAVKTGVFENKNDAIRHVLREYLEEHENDRLAAAVALSRDGDIALDDSH